SRSADSEEYPCNSLQNSWPTPPRALFANLNSSVWCLVFGVWCLDIASGLPVFIKRPNTKHQTPNTKHQTLLASEGGRGHGSSLLSDFGAGSRGTRRGSRVYSVLLQFAPF